MDECNLLYTIGFGIFSVDVSRCRDIIFGSNGIRFSFNNGNGETQEKGDFYIVDNACLPVHEDSVCLYLKESFHDPNNETETITTNFFKIDAIPKKDENGDKLFPQPKDGPFNLIIRSDENGFTKQKLVKKGDESDFYLVLPRISLD